MSSTFPKAMRVGKKDVFIDYIEEQGKGFHHDAISLVGLRNGAQLPRFIRLRNPGSDPLSDVGSQRAIGPDPLSSQPAHQTTQRSIKKILIVLYRAQASGNPRREPSAPRFRRKREKTSTAGGPVSDQRLASVESWSKSLLFFPSSPRYLAPVWLPRGASHETPRSKAVSEASTGG
ncbi:hypothetical protein Droror1_Dr00028083 [Drosera rotundifolia]